MEINSILENYKNEEFIKFNSLLGVDCNHVGLYMTNTDAENKNDTIEDIRSSIKTKNELLMFFIKNYLNISYQYLTAVDLGSGIGDTARNLYIEFIKTRKSLDTDGRCLIYSYDISSENITVNNAINFENKIPIRIYNRDFTESLFEDASINLAVSEETFHQVKDKNKLLRELSRILNNVNGYLVFSDIFLKENATEEEKRKVLELLGLSNIDKFSEFRNKAEETRLRYCNSIYYSRDLILHYSNLLNFAKKNECGENIINYLEKWLSASPLLDIGLFVFKKTY